MTTKQPSTLIEALNAFQQKHHAAGLDGSNPFYKSKYTTLAQALLAVQPATEFGLCHTQLNDYVITPEGEVITIVITKLMHVSGDEPLVSKFPVPKIPSNVKNAHQEAGAAQTHVWPETVVDAVVIPVLWKKPLWNPSWNRVISEHCPTA